MARPATHSPSCWPEVLLAAVALGCGGGGAARGEAGTDDDASATAGVGSTADAGGDTSATSDADGSGADTGELVCTAPEVRCGQICTDLMSDPDNCGGCGVSCEIIQGQGACMAGSCGLGACDVGWGNCDGDLANGCEAEADCDGGAACMTACGTTGVVVCDGTCTASCSAGVEVCNAIDDNCDMACDEGPLAGCRVGVHRSAGAVGHLYGTDLNEANANGLEMADFFHVYAAAIDGLVPLFRCNKAGGRKFLTSSTDCEATGAPELTLGFVAPDERCGSTPLYRLYAAGSDDHFYTTSAPERDNAIAMYGYADQGVAGHVFVGP